MAAHCSHPQGVIAPVAALNELFATHPELSPEASGLAWTLAPSGVLHAEMWDASDGGRAVDLCERAMGGTAVRVSRLTGPDRVVIAELKAAFHGVPVEVWETYRSPAPRLPLGAVAVLPSGGGR